MDYSRIRYINVIGVVLAACAINSHAAPLCKNSMFWPKMTYECHTTAQPTKEYLAEQARKKQYLAEQTRKNVERGDFAAFEQKPGSVSKETSADPERNRADECRKSTFWPKITYECHSSSR